MHRTFAIFFFRSDRRHLEAVVLYKADPSMIACAIGNRLDGILLPGLYEGGRRALAVGIDRDLADQIHERYPDGEPDELLRLALAHPDFDTRYAGDMREHFSVFETPGDAAAAILQKRDETLAEVMAVVGSVR